MVHLHRNMWLALAIVLLCSAAPSGPVFAGKADVLSADVSCKPAPGGRAASVCHFNVTVKHADAGWEHFANRFDILDESGTVLATRVLRHPHVDEQPFRRGLGRVRIQAAVKTVLVRANDLVHGIGGAELRVEVPHPSAGKRDASEAKE